MKKNHSAYLPLFILIKINSILCQNPFIPTNTPFSGRYDDVCFINKDTGWTVNSDGKILKTLDGGNIWQTQKTYTNTYMRSVEFSSANRGFAGGLEFSGTHFVFFKTLDGGNTWTDISSVITGTNRGICGICCVDTNVTYAVGVWSSPAYVIKTLDGGDTWTQINMSAYASRLVDVQFIDANNGYVTGQSNIMGEGAVILKTTDGGQTWTKVFTSNHVADYVWKIQNLDNINWFASIEIGSPDATNVLLKSTDGGNAWISKTVAHDSLHYQVVGFLNPMKGWIGGKTLYQTTDGGDSWFAVDTIKIINSEYDRFIRIDSNTAYISQAKIYKLGQTSVGIEENKKIGPNPFSLTIYPNPAHEKFIIKLNVETKTMYNLRIINAIGSEIIWEDVGQKEKGEYIFNINQKIPKGIYYVYLMVNEGVECKKIVIE